MAHLILADNHIAVIVPLFLLNIHIGVLNEILIITVFENSLDYVCRCGFSQLGLLLIGHACRLFLFWKKFFITYLSRIPFHVLVLRLCMHVGQVG